ncbi:MAG: serine/threonine-protein kinase RsbW [Rhodothermales bacterium]|jgi:serine/threonine-protein kinase RsbW
MRLHRRLELQSSWDHLDRVVEETEAFLLPLGLDEELAYNIVMLTTEAVTNAIEHGNAMDDTKTVVIVFEANEVGVRVTVEDEGEGFTSSDIPDPLAQENLLAEGGRGIFLMRELADEITYEKGGRAIVMRFHTPL